ncbi:HAD family hydrolase [Robertkochia solimangrovi]|uniref:HAD family hydrolase n=1 Tax=Robertkochia solimangrovi TaxID=2213046 RepID=UPI00117DBC0D|nr:HAD-IA family hydrolase [Robertkochia solimangrovi]TRZ42760.1 HAD family phosphatase [Robertkochia solimangrovi]
MDRYIIFDMDGVLVDSEPFHFKVLKAVMNSLSIEFSKSYHDTLVGTANKPMWEKLIRDFDIPHSLEAMQSGHKDMFYRMLEGELLQPTPGIHDLLQRIRESGYGLSVASSSPKKLISLVMDQLGIGDYFDHLVSGEELERSKPFPDIFLKVASLYAEDTDKFLVIEDSRNGVHAAKAAEMHCIGYYNPNSGNQDLSKADLIIDDFDVLTGARINEIFTDGKS